MSTVAELISTIDAERLKRAARAERLREQKAKSFYNSFAWRKLRYQYLRSQPQPLRCALCGSGVRDGAVLCVDHIKSVKAYPELRLDMSNLQTLCRSCNAGKASEFADDWRQGSREVASKPAKKPNVDAR
jgi:5-methylcytosine-specific restriction endonuclease McrA